MITTSGTFGVPQTPQTGGRWLLICLLLCLGTLAAPAASLKQFDVFIGYDGVLPEGNWFPVTCEVANDGPTFEAVFELTAGGFKQSQVRRLRLELPTGTMKRFVIPVFNSTRYNSTWNATLYDSKGNKRAEMRDIRVRKVTGSKAPVLGAIVRSMTSLPVFPNANNSHAEFQPMVARIQPEQFPDNPLALEGLTAVYLNSAKALTLKMQQANALLAWISAGGHLIVAVDQPGDFQANRWLGDLIPFAPTSLQQLPDHSGLKRWVETAATKVSAADDSGMNRAGVTARHPGFVNLRVDPAFDSTPLPTATGSLRDGRVVAESGGVPLVITGQRGRGRVTVLTFNPELRPITDWKERSYFWARLLDLPPEWFRAEQKGNQQHYGGYSLDAAFGAMVDSKQIRKLPVGWLVLLLLVYLAVIGPVDRWWLKKINRQMWTWLTFPAYVVLFSVLIYIIGYKLRAGDTEWNELHVVDVLPSGSGASLRGHTYASVYSPANAPYPLESLQSFAALRGEYAGPYSGWEDSRAIIEQRGNNYHAEVTVPVWTSQLYVNEWWHTLPALPVAVKVTAQDREFNIRLENRLSYKLTRLSVIIGYRIYTVGDLDSNASKTFTLSRSGGQPLRDFVRPLKDQMHNASGSRRQALGDDTHNRLQDIPSAAIATAFVGLVEEPNNYNRFIPSPQMDLQGQLDQANAVVFAWAENRTLTPGLNQFSPRRSRVDTLLRLVTPVH
ncbi:MAG: hypothetical protein WCO56_22155 [Verrucomicrobiota bacterium]